jgi:hypothetical protein
MANKYVTISYQILDSLGDTASTDDIVLAVPEADTLTQLQTHINEFTNALDDITDGQIIKITAKVDVDIVSAKSAPVEGSEVQRNARFSWSQATIPASYGVDVPAIKDELIVGGKINTADALIGLFVGAFTDVALGDGIQGVSKARNILIAPRSVLLSFRGDRGPEDRSFFT